MTATTISTFTANPTTSTTTTTRYSTTAKRLLGAGALSAIVASLATMAVAAVAKAADVPMMAAPKSAAVGEVIPTYGFAVGTLMCTAIGVVLALGLARWIKRPAAPFVAITTVLTLVSLAPPITAGHATTATKFVLCLTHVVAAAIVI